MCHRGYCTKHCKALSATATAAWVPAWVCAPYVPYTTCFQNSNSPSCRRRQRHLRFVSSLMKSWYLLAPGRRSMSTAPTASAACMHTGQRELYTSGAIPLITGAVSTLSEGQTSQSGLPTRRQTCPWRHCSALGRAPTTASSPATAVAQPVRKAAPCNAHNRLSTAL